MANYSILKSAIAQVIKTNGNNEITGNLLQQQLFSMINTLGAGYQCMGVAVLTPTPTNPGTPDANVFYIASEPGTYANFGNIVINDGEVCLLTYNGTWSKRVTGAATASQLNQLGQKVKLPEVGFRPQFVDGYSDISSMLQLAKGIYFDYNSKGVAYFGDAVATLFPIPIPGNTSVIYNGNLIGTAGILEYDENFNVIAVHYGANSLTFVTDAATKYVDFSAIYVESFSVKVAKDYTTGEFFHSGQLIGVDLLKAIYKRLPGIIDKTELLYGVGKPEYVDGYSDITSLIPIAKGVYYDSVNKGFATYSDAIASAFPIPIPGGVSVKFTGTLYPQARLLEYDENLNVINMISSGGVFTTNAKTKYVGFCSLDSSSFVVKVGIDYTSSYFEKGLTEFFTMVKTIASKNPLSCEQESLIGSIPFEGFNTSGYSHIILYGQSLSTGDNSYVPVTGVLTPVVPDVVMVGEDPTDVSGAFAQMKAKTPNNSSYVHSNGGESPICNATFAIKSFLNHTPYKNVKIIGSACGYGGTTIEQLGDVDGQYYNRFKSVVNSAKANAGAEEINCPAIVWMQGEYNQRASDTTTVADYKRKLVALKNNMQQYVMSVYGQSQKPLFFVYQPSILFTPKFPVVAQALFECAKENEDIILMNPHYFCPTSDGGHLTANGYRWYGEYIAKAILKTIVCNKRATAILPKEIEWNENKTALRIRMQIPHKVEVINNWNVPGVSNYGFAIYKNNSAVTIDSVNVNDEYIEVKLSRPIGSYTKLEFEYAGQASNGVGNIADSDEYVSFGEFVDPSTIYVAGASTDAGYTEEERTMLINSDLSHHDENGNSLSGKKYPNRNWMNTFRLDITSI